LTALASIDILNMAAFMSTSEGIYRADTGYSFSSSDLAKAIFSSKAIRPLRFGE